MSTNKWTLWSSMMRCANNVIRKMRNPPRNREPKMRLFAKCEVFAPTAIPWITGTVWIAKINGRIKACGPAKSLANNSNECVKE